MKVNFSDPYTSKTTFVCSLNWKRKPNISYWLPGRPRVLCRQQSLKGQSCVCTSEQITLGGRSAPQREWKQSIAASKTTTIEIAFELSVLIRLMSPNCVLTIVAFTMPLWEFWKVSFFKQWLVTNETRCLPDNKWCLPVYTIYLVLLKWWSKTNENLYEIKEANFLLILEDFFNNFLLSRPFCLNGHLLNLLLLFPEERKHPVKRSTNLPGITHCHKHENWPVPLFRLFHY